jgi:type I restriction enzyme S subunit
MDKQKHIPKLRFPEFKDEWKKKKLGELTYKTDKKNKNKELLPIYSISNKFGFIPQASQFEGMDSIERGYDTTLYKVIENNTFAYNPARINVGSIGYNENLGRLIVSSLYVCFQTNNEVYDKFLNHFFDTSKFNKYVLSNGEGGVRIYLFYENFSLIPFSIPSLPEQQKIATFLTAVDDKLQAIKKKKALLEQYKKGVMQKLFSQELRFKDVNGNEFPDWEEKKLGDVFYSEKGKGISKNKVVENGNFECILYGELYTRYNEVIFNIVSRTNESDGVKSKIGDLLIPSSTTTTGIDLANVTALNKDNVLLGGDITVLRSNKKIYNIFYAYYLSNYKKDEIASYAQGSTIVHLYYSHIKEMVIDLPCLIEQTKIANFLSSIDDKINHMQEQINKMEVWKKGLLQKMFV